jgi:protein arginine N-methyltransferase 1
MSVPNPYNLADYGGMIADDVRTEAYASALRHTVTPTSVVLDIGTGAGIFALLACQLGARRVYAIESDDVIEVAREAASENGFADRIEFIQGASTQVMLPERADVIVSDLHGKLPLFRDHLPSIVDARKRLLAPGGALIPKRDTLWAVLVEEPELYRVHVDTWTANRYGIQMSAARSIATNMLLSKRVSPSGFLVEPTPWTVLDYELLESANVSAELEWSPTRSGTAHGICLWFDATLTDRVAFSNAPAARRTVYGNAFLPLSEPVPIVAEDSISVALRADLVAHDYVWRWRTRVMKAGSTEVKADFKQTTLFGFVLSPTSLRRTTGTHRPLLNEDGAVDRFILGSMDGAKSLLEIANETYERFSSHFEEWKGTFEHVCDLSRRYSQ